MHKTGYCLKLVSLAGKLSSDFEGPFPPAVQDQLGLTLGKVRRQTGNGEPVKNCSAENDIARSSAQIGASRPIAASSRPFEYGLLSVVAFHVHSECDFSLLSWQETSHNTHCKTATRI